MTPTTSDCRPADLDYRLERWIEQRTGGRVHRLRVDHANGRTLVQGHTGSYYVRQLALAAVMDILDSCNGSRPEPVEIDIQVSRDRAGAGPASASERREQPILVSTVRAIQSEPGSLQPANTQSERKRMIA